MGQYYQPILGDKDGFNCLVFDRSIDGERMVAKLTEHSWWLNPFVNSFAHRLFNQQKRVCWVGDYAQDDDFVFPINTAIHTPTYEEVWGDTVELHSSESVDFTLDGKFLINFDTMQFLDLSEYKMLSLDRNCWIIHPLPLLTAVGNGRGLGDFHEGYIGFEFVGIYSLSATIFQWTLIKLISSLKKKGLISMQKLASKFINVMQECSHIEKNGVNSFHKYKYATSSDVMLKVNSALTKYGIASFVSPSLISLQDVTTIKGNVEHLATVEVEIKLVDKDSGEEAILKGLGNGQDSGDKAVAKALTSAMKYAYMMSLAISTGDDPEADTSTDENTYVEDNEIEQISQTQQQLPPRQSPPVQQRQQPQQRARQQAVRNNNLTCYDCGAKISQKVADYSADKFGRHLCFNCQQAQQAA